MSLNFNKLFNLQALLFSVLSCEQNNQCLITKQITFLFQYLSLDTDHNTHTITAKLRRNELTTDLVGRYTCSEIINDKNHEKTVHVFIQGIYFLYFY